MSRTASYSLYLNSQTGDYEYDSVTKDAKVAVFEMTEAYTRLKSPRRKWLYAPNEFFGSDLNMYENKATKVTPVALQKTIYESQLPMVELGEINELQVNYIGIGSDNAYMFTVQEVTLLGDPISFTYPNYEVINGNNS